MDLADLVLLRPPPLAEVVAARRRLGAPLFDELAFLLLVAERVVGATERVVMEVAA